MRTSTSRVNLRLATRPGDLGWMVMAHGEIYYRQFGYTTEFEALVAGIVGEYATHHDPSCEAVWIAEVDGVRAGCVMLIAGNEPGVARLRVLLVSPAARGHGLGTRLVEQCLTFARESGYRQVTLWTTAEQGAARRVYENAGFTKVDEEPPRHRWGHDLVGQTWLLDL
ncbi:GNAT family N-acetyltransferase [Actinoplanes sp. GCM10030250]|uniref:GNAT family N-acetyltransferase n=1 Tax=Actinoplanes sp. GCM10030250 TaxID=3273376 RepID=UPI00360B48E6